MRNLFLSIILGSITFLDAQTIDTIYNDTLMLIHNSDGSMDSFNVTEVDSITFLNRNDTVWVSNSPCGNATSVSYHGHTYELVDIAGQCWFKENLQTTKYRNGIDLSEPLKNSNLGQYCWYDDDSVSYASTYGALYNYKAVNDTSGLCPIGWHVPTKSEWQALLDYLNTNGYNYDGSNSGYKICKALADTITWNYHSGTGNVGNTDYPSYRNKSGLSLRAGGRATTSGVWNQPTVSWMGIDIQSGWWTASPSVVGNYYLGLAWSYDYYYNGNGFSDYYSAGYHYVRCIKD